MSDTTLTKRHRFLLVVLGLVVLYYVGRYGYENFVEGPADKNARLKAQLTKKLKSQKQSLTRAVHSVDRLEQLEQKSLPWDAAMARSRYQAWLLRLAQEARLEGTSVDSSEPIPVTRSFRRSRSSVELYKRFTFSVRGRGDLGQITEFMYSFYRGGHLQKIRSLNLNPVGQGQQIDMTLSIEAIALPNADRETELTSLVSEELAMPDVRDYQLIARRNFFGRGGTRGAWKQIELSAVTSDTRGIGEAWFKVAGHSQTVMLEIGQSLSQPSFDVTVVALDELGATVNVDGQLYRLTIGQTLADAAPVQ